jgi:hypothetical protein
LLSRNHVGNPIEKHGDKPSQHYAPIANEMVRDGSISANAFRVLALLLSHDTNYQESAGEIAKRFGWGRNRAIKALRELVAARLLVIQNHVTQQGTRAYETYHVHMSRRFTEAEVERLGRPRMLITKQSTAENSAVKPCSTDDRTKLEARWLIDNIIPSDDPKYLHAEALVSAAARHMLEKGTSIEAVTYALAKYLDRQDARGPQLFPLLLDDALALDQQEADCIPYVALDRSYYEAIGEEHNDPWAAHDRELADLGPF